MFYFMRHGGSSGRSASGGVGATVVQYWGRPGRRAGAARPADPAGGPEE